MAKQGVDGRVKITIERIGEYFMVDIKDVLRPKYAPKRKVYYGKEFMINFTKEDYLNLLF